MGQRVLKTQVGRTVSEDGRLLRDDKQKFYIETHGELRMSIEIPRYVCVLLPNLKIKERANTTYKPDECRIYGRDPASIAQVWDEIIKAYMDRKKELVIVPVIAIKFKSHLSQRGFSSPTYGSDSIELAMSAFRLLQEPEKEPSLSGRDGSTYYKWRDTENDALERVSMYDKFRILPYSDELWERVQAMQLAIRSGVERVAEFIHSKDIEDRLMAGPTLLSIGVDQP